ncbi:MAG: hypothetical protein Q9216_001262 [Gyalolechia sp. 2 TL-2023]
MESVVFEDSPLALYLQGKGEKVDNEWTQKDTVIKQPNSPLQPSAFAPQGFPAHSRRRRPKPPRLLNLERPLSKGAIARLHRTCSSALDAKLGWAENGRFLERFRYTIIASQLLNDRYNPGIYKRHITSSRPEADCLDTDKDVRVAAFSWLGLASTALAAFVLVWSIHWTRDAARSTTRIWSLVLTPAVALTVCSVFYVYFRSKRLHWIRSQAVESASTLVEGAQNLDAVVSASINLIQEIELVYRGYRMAFEETKSLAVEADLEKYYDIYEISRSEMQEAEEFQNMHAVDLGDDTLKAFKIGLYKLYLARKLFYCSLLALGADGGKVDSAKWLSATKTMDTLTVEGSKATQDMEEILGTGEGKKFMSRPCVVDSLKCSHRYTHSHSFEDAVDAWKGKDAKPNTEA